MASLFSLYLTLNIVFVVAFVSLKAISLLAKLAKQRLSSPVELKIHYSTFFVILFIAATIPFWPNQNLFDAPVKVWAASSSKEYNSGSYISRPVVALQASKKTQVEADFFTTVIGCVCALIFLFLFFKLSKDLRLIFKLRNRAVTIRKIGNLSIRVSTDIDIPFSARTLFHVDVVVPAELLSRGDDFRICVAHEIQHHRQGDTLAVYLLFVLRALFPFNPSVHFWNQWLNEIQEFACDETLVDLKKVDSRQYARCLVQVAQTAFDRKSFPVCATGLAFSADRKILKRRIEKMMQTKERFYGTTLTKSSLTLALAVMVSLLAASAYASRGMVQDRRISLDDAKRMMAHGQRSADDIPAVVNDLVLVQLNRYCGTPEGRDYMRKSLSRMETYRSVVEDGIRKYQMPEALMAIPLMESGYVNELPGDEAKNHGAGLWSFIASTARKFGLRVDDTVDERFKPEILTDAAMRLLKSDQLMFRDWGLTLLAYNAGEGHVQQAIAATGSRDPWQLVRKGYENDKNYLSKVMAAILIMRNPDCVN